MLPKFKKFMKNEAKPTRNRQVVTNERVSGLSGNSKMCQISDLPHKLCTIVLQYLQFT